MTGDRSMKHLFDPDCGVGVRPMWDTAAEYELLSSWMSDERVLEWVYGRDNAFSLERTVSHFGPRVRGEDPTRACMITLDDQAIGFLQYTPVDEPSAYGLDHAEDAWGMDVLIGEPELWSGGYGSTAFRLLCGFLVEHEGAKRLLIDPRVENPRAVRAYEKVGFRTVKILEGHEFHEGRACDARLMEMLAEDLERSLSSCS